MAELSIIELIVYGIVGYSGLIFLIASAFKELPAQKSQSMVRSIWILAPLFCMYMLSSAGAQINFYDITTIEYNATNTNQVIGNFTETQNVTLVQPVWVTLHMLFFFMLLIYFIWNMLMILVKRD